MCLQRLKKQQGMGGIMTWGKGGCYACVVGKTGKRNGAWNAGLIMKKHKEV